MTVEVVLFDLGGVVLRYDPNHRLAELSRLTDLPPNIIDARIWQTDLSTRFDEGRITPDEWYDECSTRLGRCLERHVFDQALLSAFAIDTEILQIVQSIRGPKVAAFTNNSAQFAAALPRLLPEIVTTFDAILCSYQFGAQKPNPAAFHGAIGRLQVAPEHVVFFDDQVANVAAARAIGIDAETFTGAAMLRASLDRRMLTSLD